MISPISHLDYYTNHKLICELGGQTIQYISKPGIPDWSEIPPALHLLAYHAKPEANAVVRCINCGPGALTVFIAEQLTNSQCIVSTPDILTLACNELSRDENLLENVVINPENNNSPDIDAQVDLVLLQISKGRKLNRRWLVQAWNSLKSGGRLLLCGANGLGIQSIIKDASQIFSKVSIIAYKKGNRLAQLIKSDSQQHLPSWATEPGVVPGTWHEIRQNIPGYDLDLVSLPGIFSYTGIDEGTRLLISTLDDQSGKTVLDAGCGYGLLGLCAAMRGARAVDMVDSQLLAVESSLVNAALNQLSQCHVAASDLLSAVASKTYSSILTNPPFHAGRQVDYQIAHALIASAYAVLDRGGQLRLVANRFIRYDRLMSELFGNVSIITQSPTYHVLASEKE
jgi:16S rRNA (guanine1207-N2)-methyltransferase